MASVRLNRKYQQLPAFTLFESTVAITIIAVVIGISTIIYSNVIQAEKPLDFYQARQEIDQIFADMKSNKAFFDKTFDFESFSIEQKIGFYRGNKKLYQVDYAVKQTDKVLWLEHHLVANTEHGR